MSNTEIAGESQRLGELRNGLFTSDLSINELVLIKRAGFAPLGMVVGSSIYHIGLQVARWNNSQELEVLSRAMHDAREQAVNRMQAEAAALGADGIIGTDLILQAYVGGQNVLEFVAIGTAISYSAEPGALRTANGQPFTSHIDGDGFVKLWREGLVPTHFSFGVCVYHVAHQTALQSMRQVGQNIEMPIYTQAIYSAREIALERMQSEAKAIGSVGIVGTGLKVANHVWGEHAVEFMAYGTGVRAHQFPVAPMADPVYVMPI